MNLEQLTKTIHESLDAKDTPVSTKNIIAVLQALCDQVLTEISALSKEQQFMNMLKKRSPTLWRIVRVGHYRKTLAKDTCGAWGMDP